MTSSSAFIKDLQRIQNTAARLVTRTKCDKHVTPELGELRWLPVQERIVYKVPLLTFKTVQITAPPVPNGSSVHFHPQQESLVSIKNFFVPAKNQTPTVWGVGASSVRHRHCGTSCLTPWGLLVLLDFSSESLEIDLFLQAYHTWLECKVPRAVYRCFTWLLLLLLLLHAV